MDGGLSLVMPTADVAVLRGAVRQALAVLATPGADRDRLARIGEILAASLADPALSIAGFEAGSEFGPERGPERNSEQGLTQRQRQTLVHLADGLSNRLIARRMGIEEETVKTQVRVLLDRLGLRNRTALALWAVRNGIVPLADSR